MRYLAWFSLGFAAACCLCAYLLSPGYLILSAVICLLIAAGLLILCRKNRKLLIVFLLFLGAASGIFRFCVSYKNTAVKASKADGRSEYITAEVSDLPEKNQEYEKVSVKILDGTCKGLKSVLYIYDEIPEKSLRPGNVIGLRVRFRDARVLYGRTSYTYSARDIFVTGTSQSRVKLFKEHTITPVRYFPKIISAALKNEISVIFPEETESFMRSLLLGDKTDLYRDVSLYQSMSRAGLMHAVAVSGLHISFLAGAVIFIFGRTRRASLFSIAVVWLFVFISGTPASAVRAAVMMSILLLAPVLQRQNDPLTSLSFALLLILAVNPYAVTGTGLQLSFSAMAGIQLISPAFENFTASLRAKKGVFAKLAVYISGIAASSLSVLVFSIPLMAVHFKFVSVISPLTNVLCLWAVSICFIGGFAACIAGCIIPVLGKGIALFISYFARYIICVVKLLSDFNYSCVYINGIYGIWLVLSYIVILYLIFSKKRKTVLVPAGITVIIGIFIGATAFSSYYYSSPKAYFTTVNVGQGQSLALYSGDKTILIDCGSTYTTENAGIITGAYLSSCARHKADYLILTHLHSDHCNGVEYLEEIVDVENLIIPDSVPDDDDMLDTVMTSAERNGVNTILLGSDAEIECDNISISLYSPDGDAVSENESCIMMLIDAAGFRILVTGDANSESEEQLIFRHHIPDIDLLVAGHHGSKYSSGADFLKKISPEYAVVSTGFNTYGHPAPEALERLEHAGCRIYRTDKDGNVCFRID